MTLELLREHRQVALLAMAYLEDHWDDLPLCGCAPEVPRDWIEDLTAEFAAAIEDRGREWMAAKRVTLGEAKLRENTE